MRRSENRGQGAGGLPTGREVAQDADGTWSRKENHQCGTIVTSEARASSPNYLNKLLHLSEPLLLYVSIREL